MERAKLGGGEDAARAMLMWQWRMRVVSQEECQR